VRVYATSNYLQKLFLNGQWAICYSYVPVTQMGALLNNYIISFPVNQHFEYKLLQCSWGFRSVRIPLFFLYHLFLPGYHGFFLFLSPNALGFPYDLQKTTII